MADTSSLIQALARLGFALAILGLSGCATGEVAPGSPGERTYVNQAYGWSVAYPLGWAVDGSKPGSVIFRRDRPSGVLGIHTTTGHRSKSLDEIADSVLRIFPSPRYVVVSRRTITLRTGIAAIEVVHHIGVGIVGKSRKVITTVKGRVFVIDAETYLDSWDVVEPYFNQIVDSFTIRE